MTTGRLAGGVMESERYNANRQVRATAKELETYVAQVLKVVTWRTSWVSTAGWISTEMVDWGPSVAPPMTK